MPEHIVVGGGTGGTDVANRLADGLAAELAAGDAADEPPQRPGAVGLLRALRDPEVQVGLGFLVALSRALGGEPTRRSAADGA